jgi:hypothetical protein
MNEWMNHIQAFPGSVLGPETGCPNRDFTLFFSVPLGRCQDSTLGHSHFRIFSTSLISLSFSTVLVSSINKPTMKVTWDQKCSCNLYGVCIPEHVLRCWKRWMRIVAYIAQWGIYNISSLLPFIPKYCSIFAQSKNCGVTTAGHY